MTQDEAYINDIIETGSLVAYKSLVEKYEKRVFSFCFKIIRHREEAEEVAQDVFVRCFSNLSNLKDRTKFPNWLMKIAYSKAIDRVRKKQMLKTDIDQLDTNHFTDEKTPLKTTIDQNRKEILKKAIDQLEPVEASMITLYYLQDMAVKDIAEITGMTLSNVKVKLYRARKTLKTIIVSRLRTDLDDFIQEES